MLHPWIDDLLLGVGLPLFVIAGYWFFTKVVFGNSKKPDTDENLEVDQAKLSENSSKETGALASRTFI